MPFAGYLVFLTRTCAADSTAADCYGGSRAVLLFLCINCTAILSRLVALEGAVRYVDGCTVHKDCAALIRRAADDSARVVHFKGSALLYINTAAFFIRRAAGDLACVVHFKGSAAYVNAAAGIIRRAVFDNA